MSKFTLRPHPCELFNKDYIVFERDGIVGLQLSFNRADLPALRDAIDAYLRPADYVLTPDAVERITDQLKAGIGGIGSGKIYGTPPGARLEKFNASDKDPLPEPSLRIEIDELRRRVTHLEELIAIV